jgi:transcriptional regulator with PAS, ATPase and Fis domain
MRNLIERSVLLSSGSYIDAADLGLRAHVKESAKFRNGNLSTLDEMEKEHIHRVLLATNHNLTKAADVLGITRATLYSKIKRYNLSTS